MEEIIKKEHFTYRLHSVFSDLDTDLDIYLTWQKKNIFSKKVSVLIWEKRIDGGQLYVEPHFETVANGILNSKLKGLNPKNIRWFHYNPFHQPYNTESIRNYSEVIPIYKDREIVNASWKDLHFLPEICNN